MLDDSSSADRNEMAQHFETRYDRLNKVKSDKSIAPFGCQYITC